MDFVALSFVVGLLNTPFRSKILNAQCTNASVLIILAENFTF